jgi:hypothetical protein
VPIDIRVAGDPTACSQCGAALSKLGGQISDDATVFTHAGNVSMDEWQGEHRAATKAQAPHCGPCGQCVTRFPARRNGVRHWNGT